MINSVGTMKNKYRSIKKALQNIFISLGEDDRDMDLVKHMLAMAILELENKEIASSAMENYGFSTPTRTKDPNA